MELYSKIKNKLFNSPPVLNNSIWDRYEQVENLILNEGESEPIKNFSKKVILIVTPTERNGHNYLNHILNIHPNIVRSLGGEQHFLQDSNQLLLYAQNTVAKIKGWMKKGSIQQEYFMRSMVVQFGNGIYSLLDSISPTKEYHIIKTSSPIGIENFFHLFPNGKVFMLFRDGRDTVQSHIDTWPNKWTFESATQHWVNNTNKLYDFYEKVQKTNKAKHVSLVKYETILEGKKQNQKLLFDFLNVSISEKQLGEIDKLPIHGSSTVKSKNGKVFEKKEKDTSGFNPTGKWGSWNNKNTQYFKKNAGEVLIRLDYENDLNW